MWSRLSLRKCWQSPWWSLSLVFLLGLGLRCWQLGRFNTLVFDEVHYVRFAYQYLQGEPAFDVHPPLGKYVIALGMTLYQHLPWQWGSVHTELAVPLAPLGYRWMNALVGALTPPVAMALVLGLSRPERWGWAWLTGIFLATDGLFVVESRYALINLYLVFFGLLGHALWAQAARLRPNVARHGYRLLAGMALGACIAVKWTGLAWIPGLLAMGDCLTPAASAEATADRPFLRPTLVDWLLYAGVVPLVTYCLVWIPHELMTGENLITLHQRMWRFHQHLGQAVHPYCSAWYTWPLMLRPVAYQYEATPTVIYDVHGISNPMLIWLSTAAVGLLTIQQAAPLASQTIGWLRRQISQRLSKRIWSRLGVAPAAGQLAEQQQRRQAKRHSSIHGRRLDPVATYLVVNYALNWLPWALIHRCTFFYHYMSAAAFSFMGLAWWLSRWWQISAWRGMTVLLLAAIATAFWFWLPIHLGAPLSPAELQARWWLRSWI